MEKKIQSYVLIFGEVIYGSVDKMPIFFLSIITSRLSAVLYLPSSGFLASAGIFQLRPWRATPGIFPSEHLVKEQVPLSERIIKQIHYLVLADKKDDRGVYRRVPVRIMGAKPPK